MEDIDRPRLNLAEFIKPETSLKSTYETLLKEDSVNKLRFTPNHQIYPFNIYDFDLHGIISSTEKSTVKKYLHKPSKKTIAVKYVHVPHSIYKDEKREKEMQKLIQEIKIHQQLSFSKHIVKLYGFCVYEGDALICMELMDMSLKEFYMNVHEKYNHFPEYLLGVICASIVRAFQDLHRVEIIHRDIKPNNILINSNGQIKLCDFGEARLLENNLATSIVGTMAYWPPERMKGERTYDSRSDIWSLGITLAELIYGRLPFEDEGGNELDNCLMVICYIRSLNTAELVYKCFSKANCSYEYARDFVASCLGKCENRPKYKDLLKTAFYRRYCDLARDKIVQKYMDSSSLRNANKRRQSSSISKFESYTHWERNLNGKVLSTENKMHLNVQKHFKIPFKIPRRYIPNEKVGVGVRGVTMKAFDNKLHKFVAIKELSYIYMKSGEAYREFMLLQKLDHKNIAKLAYTPATSADNFFQAYFVMDYVEFPLRLVIYNRQMIFGQDGGHLNIAFLMFQLLSGINYLHNIGIVHRELSPDSIVVSKDFHLKIAHLGLVQVLDENRKRLSYSNASAYLTTSAYYRAPEILLGHEYNHKVDLWSIGCILAELLTGNHLFRGNSFVFLFKESNYYFQLVKIIEVLQLTTENLSFKPDELSHEYIFTIKEEINKIFIRLQSDKPIPWETLFPDSVFPRANKSVSKITFLTEWNHKKLAKRGRDFVSKLIEINPEKRISSEEALRHHFLKPYDSQKMEQPKEKINLEELFEAKKISYEEWNEFLFEVIKNYEKKQNSGKEHKYLEKINGVYQVAE